MSEALHFPFAAPPEHGTIEAVADGVYWLRMPLPLTGLDHINLWLLADGEGWTVVDCGIETAEIRGLWEQIFVEHLGARPVRRVIVTHFHPDHVGLAGWLCERWGAELWMSRTEWLFGRMLCLDRQAAPPDSVIAFFRAAGYDERMLDAIRERGFGNYARVVSPIPDRMRRIQEGEVLSIGGREWRVAVGRGHAPEHACLYSAELGAMISGDHVLPGISPHIGVYPGEPEANPLKEYLASLPDFYAFPEETLVLPSHKEPFRGLHRRLDALMAHHDERLERVLEACAEPRSAVEVRPALFERELDHFVTVLAVAGTIAHLHYLVDERRLARERGTDGVVRFVRTAGQATAPARAAGGALCL